MKFMLTKYYLELDKFRKGYNEQYLTSFKICDNCFTSILEKNKNKFCLSFSDVLDTALQKITSINDESIEYLNQYRRAHFSISNESATNGGLDYEILKKIDDSITKTEDLAELVSSINSVYMNNIFSYSNVLRPALSTCFNFTINYALNLPFYSCSAFKMNHRYEYRIYAIPDKVSKLYFEIKDEANEKYDKFTMPLNKHDNEKVFAKEISDFAQKMNENSLINNTSLSPAMSSTFIKKIIKALRIFKRRDTYQDSKANMNDFIEILKKTDHKLLNDKNNEFSSTIKLKWNYRCTSDKQFYTYLNISNSDNYELILGVGFDNKI